MSTNNLKKSTWLITAKTNLHAGDESSTSYGLIDKSVQRDALMKLPCINSSSLKGALNEFCIAKTDLTGAQRVAIFGADKKEIDKKVQKGTTLFFDAGILFLPVQDDNDLYKLACCDEIIEQFIEKAKTFGANIEKDALLEKYANVVKMEEKEFIRLCSDDELPIIARNVLENGESKNLWYEQVIPPETVFYTFMQSPRAELENKLEGEIVQIGANATIGYGYCKFTEIKKS